MRKIYALTTQEIQQLFDSFTNRKILIIGDVMIDSYLLGKVERISPEAPVPVVTWQNQENRLGGAANVALNIQALGANATLCAVTGDDERADAFQELMQKRQLAYTGIMRDSDRMTTIKTRVISGNQQLLRVDRENDHYLSVTAEGAFLRNILGMLNETRFDAIIFQDYDKGSITPAVIKEVIAAAAKKQIPVLVDPKKRNFTAYKGATLFKPNFKELKEGLKVDLDKSNPDALAQAVKPLLTNWNLEQVMVTLSEKGVFIANPNEQHQIPAEVRDIADVSGAGDTVISVAGLCLASGMASRDIAWVSNIAGGLVCERVGVVPVNRQELLNECLQLAGR